MIHMTETGYVCLYVVGTNPSGWRGYGRRDRFRGQRTLAVSGRRRWWWQVTRWSPRDITACSILHWARSFVLFSIMNSSETLWDVSWRFGRVIPDFFFFSLYLDLTWLNLTFTLYRIAAVFNDKSRTSDKIFVPNNNPWHPFRKDVAYRFSAWFQVYVTT
jgi:hypothetical protein